MTGSHGTGSDGRTRIARTSALVVVVTIASVLLVAMPSHAEPSGRTVEGSIAAVSPKLDGSRPARCAWEVHGEASQGVVGFVVPLRQVEGNGRHFLTASVSDPGPAASADLDVYFHAAPGTCDAPTTETGRSTDNEHGRRVQARIPIGSRYALVVSAAAVGQPMWCYAIVCPPPPVSGAAPVDFTVTIEPGPCPSDLSLYPSPEYYSC